MGDFSIRSSIGLDEEARTRIRELAATCSLHDGFESCAFMESDLNSDLELKPYHTAGSELFVGFLEVFAPGPAELEINAFVHPAFRKSGVFKRLLESAKREIRSSREKTGTPPDLLFGFDDRATAAKSIARKMGAGLSHLEYVMKLDVDAWKSLTPHPSLPLSLATAEHLEKAIQATMAIFDDDECMAASMLTKCILDDTREQYIVRDEDSGRIIAMAALGLPEGSISIHGLGVLPSLRGHKMGSRLLDTLVGTLLAREEYRDRSITLEVDSLNKAACALYRSHGFVETKTTEYWRLPLVQELPPIVAG